MIARGSAVARQERQEAVAGGGQEVTLPQAKNPSWLKTGFENILTICLLYVTINAIGRKKIRQLIIVGPHLTPHLNRHYIFPASIF